MLPLNLTIENFMGNVKSELDFTLFDSCLVVGRNKHNDRESNGTGKSTIFKAIDFVLFGEYPTRHIDKIVREGEDKCTVAMEFMSGASTYRATRIRRVQAGQTELRLDEKAGDKWVPKGQRTSGHAAKELAKLVRINYESFKSSVLFAQGDLSGLAAATPDKRKALLKEPLQLAIYSKFEKIAKTKTKALEEEYKLLCSRISTLGNPQIDIGNYSKQIKKLEKEIKKCCKDIATNNELQNTKKECLVEVNNKINNSVVVPAGKLHVVKTKLSKQEGVLAKSKQSISDTESSKDKYNITLELTKKLIKIAQTTLDEINKESLRSDEDIQEDIEKLQKKEQKEQIHLAQLQSDLDRCDHILPEDAECPKCKQGICAEYRSEFLSSNQERKEKLHADWTLHSDRRSKVQDKIIVLRKEARDAAATIKRRDNCLFDIKSHQSKIDNIKDIISQLEKSILEFISVQHTAENEIAELKEEEKLLNEEIQKFDADKLQAQANSLGTDIRNLAQIINDLSSELSSKYRELGNVESAIDRCHEDVRKIAAYQADKEKTSKLLSIMQKGTTAFSPKGIPTLIINTILDDLQIEVNKLLQELRPELSLQFIVEKENQDTLDIVFKVDGSERDYNLLSGGQKMYIALSMKMGLSAVIQKRLGVDIKFLELDEVDQSLDKAGVDAFASVMKSWQSKWKIFVVTHNETLKNFFNHAILVEKIKAGSTAKVVTQW